MLLIGNLSKREVKIIRTALEQFYLDVDDFNAGTGGDITQEEIEALRSQLFDGKKDDSTPLFEANDVTS